MSSYVINNDDDEGINVFNGIEIISRQRKEFYIETFKIRFEKQILATIEDIKAKLRK